MLTSDQKIGQGVKFIRRELERDLNLFGGHMLGFQCNQTQLLLISLSEMG